MDSARLLAWQRDIESGLIPVEIFGDEAVLRLELERIFGKSWLFVAHETEVPNCGDFVLRRFGQDEVICVRDKRGTLRVLLNHCRHRGTPVCREHRGNASQFRCPYHGWVYDNSGAWVGAPFKRQSYPALDESAWGLLSAPRVESYRGLVFASLDEGAPPLREYLGDMCWYLDCAFGLHSDGMYVHTEAQRWRVRANWKTAAENFLCDAYHVPSLHRSIEGIGLVPDVNKAVERQFHLDLENGHGAILSERMLPPPWSTWGYPPQVSQLFELERLTPEQRRFLDTYLITTFTIYPNLSFIRVPGLPEPGLAPVVYTCLRQWQPVAADEIEIWSWTLSWRVAPAWFNDAAHKASLCAFGPAGMFEQDDTVAWSGAPAMGRSVFAQRRGQHLHYQMGNANPEYRPRTDWMGPGVATTTALGEGPQRSFYRRWLHDMRRPAPAAAASHRLPVLGASCEASPAERGTP